MFWTNVRRTKVMVTNLVEVPLYIYIRGRKDGGRKYIGDSSLQCITIVYAKEGRVALGHYTQRITYVHVPLLDPNVSFVESARVCVRVYVFGGWGWCAGAPVY